PGVDTKPRSDGHVAERKTRRAHDRGGREGQHQDACPGCVRHVPGCSSYRTGAAGRDRAESARSFVMTRQDPSPKMKRTRRALRVTRSVERALVVGMSSDLARRNGNG